MIPAACARCSKPLQKRDTAFCFQCSPSRRLCGGCIHKHNDEHRSGAITTRRPQQPPMAPAEQKP